MSFVLKSSTSTAITILHLSLESYSLGRIRSKPCGCYGAGPADADVKSCYSRSRSSSYSDINT